MKVKRLLIYILLIILLFTPCSTVLAQDSISGTGGGTAGEHEHNESGKYVFHFRPQGLGVRFSLYKYTGGGVQNLEYLSSVDYLFQDVPKDDKDIKYFSFYALVHETAPIYGCGGDVKGSLAYKYGLDGTKLDPTIKIIPNNVLDVTVNTSFKPYALVKRNPSTTYATFDDFYESVTDYFSISTVKRVNEMFGVNIDESKIQNYYITAEPTINFHEDDEYDYFFYGTSYELSMCITVGDRNKNDHSTFQNMRRFIAQRLNLHMYNAYREKKDDYNFTNFASKNPLVDFVDPEPVCNPSEDVCQNKIIRPDLENNPASGYGISIFWLGDIITSKTCSKHVEQKCPNASSCTVSQWNSYATDYCDSKYQKQSDKQACLNGCVQEYNVTEPDAIAGSCGSIATNFNSDSLNATCNEDINSSSKICYLSDTAYYRIICDEKISTSSFPGVTEHLVGSGASSSFSYDVSIDYTNTCYVEWNKGNDEWERTNNPTNQSAITVRKNKGLISLEEYNNIISSAKITLNNKINDVEEPNFQIYIQEKTNTSNTTLTIWPKIINREEATTKSTYKLKVDYSIGELYLNRSNNRTYSTKQICESVTGNSSDCVKVDGKYYVSIFTPVGNNYQKNSSLRIGIDNHFNINGICHYEVNNKIGNDCKKTCNGLENDEYIECSKNYCGTFYINGTSEYNLCIDTCEYENNDIVNCLNTCGNQLDIDSRNSCAKNFCLYTSSECYKGCSLEEKDENDCVEFCENKYKGNSNLVIDCIKNTCLIPVTGKDYIYRRINISDPFPNNREPGRNWWGKVEYITKESDKTDKTNEYYDQTPSNGNEYEYRFVVTPNDMVEVRNNIVGKYSEINVYSTYNQAEDVVNIYGYSKELADSLNKTPAYCSSFIHDYLIPLLGEGRYNVRNGACN